MYSWRKGRAGKLGAGKLAEGAHGNLGIFKLAELR